MADSEHFTSGDYVGVYYKYDSNTYRGTCAGCGRGYHSNRWDAHHILPGVAFSQITDQFALDCLKITNFDINAAYSMGGLPKLTAFILACQNDPDMPKLNKALEQTVTMLRWGTVKQYANQAAMAIIYPGNVPVHNPANWGHTDYNEEVIDDLRDKVFARLKGKGDHPKPKDAEAALKSAVTRHWNRLKAIANGPGGGGFSGTRDNLKNRYDKAANGWWKPLCMSRAVKSAPASPSMK